MKGMDRRILRTREAINSAFIELMAEKEFDQITINQISERANLNRGTIYLHYVDKYDLLDKCMEEHIDRLIKLCVPNDRDQDEVNNKEVDTLQTAFEYVEEHFKFYSTMLTSKGVPTFSVRIKQLMMDGIREQVNMDGINEGLNKEILVEFMASATVGLVEWWIKNQMPHTPQYMATQIRDLLARHQVYN